MGEGSGMPHVKKVMVWLDTKGLVVWSDTQGLVVWSDTQGGLGGLVPGSQLVTAPSTPTPNMPSKGA